LELANFSICPLNVSIPLSLDALIHFASPLISRTIACAVEDFPVPGIELNNPKCGKS